jgi:hypothetical protein
MDLSELSSNKYVAIAASVVTVLVVGILIYMYFFSGPKKEAAVHLAPPAGYPDVEPYNTKSWQDMQKKAEASGQNAPRPPGPPGM